MAKDIYVIMTGKWAGYKAGDIVRCGGSKGEMLIKKGLAERTKKQRAINDPPEKKAVKVETAVASPPAENAMAAPVVTEKKDVKPPVVAEKKDKAKTDKK